MTDPEGPTPGFAAPYAQPRSVSDDMREVENNSLLWLIVGAVGFWFGLGWLTGPLGWYFGGQARNKYAALGRTPSSKANAAWIVGIVTTVLSYLAVAIFLMLFAFAGSVVINYP
jgi:hypothetical protein